MLSKFRTLHHFTHLLSPTITTRTLNASTPLSTMVHSKLSQLFKNPKKSQLSPQSPEIPTWVTSSNNPIPNSDEDEDFVIPSLAHWVDSILLESKPKPVKNQSLDENANLVDVEAIGIVLKERYSSHELVVEALDGHGFRVSDGVVMQILNRFSNDWVPAFGFFIWAKTQTPYKHNSENYNLMVDIMGKFNEFDFMWELVKEMSLLEGYVSLDTMTKVMRRLAKGHKFEDAVESFRRMGEFGVEKDTTALNVMLDALVKAQCIEVAHDALLEFKSSVPLSSPSFNILINGWCRVRNFENARKTMEERKEHGFEPDVFSYNTLIEGYCHEKDFRKVDQVLEEMREKGCPPNAVTYTIVMLALGKAGQLSKALEEYERMKQGGIAPDTPFYSSLIFILGKAGRFKDACDVFEDMPKQGLVRDVVTYSTMITTACAHSKEETALKLLKEMEETSCKPHLQTYHPLIKMCCKMKRMKVLKFLLDHMFKNDISPDLGTYTLLVQSLCKSGKLKDACIFFEEMVLKGLTPIETTFKLLVKKLESESMLKEKDHIEKLMLRIPGEHI